MISSLQKKTFKFFHPILRRMAKLYLSKPRNYTYKGIRVKILPGVFHPGFFFSTKVFLEFLETLVLEDKRVLELGAGSAFISIFCALKGAKVTASDISPTAIEGIKKNAELNKQEIKVVLSDLFDKFSIEEFDIILINPPYYPKKPSTIEERAWFCGEEFEYFHRLFDQAKPSKNNKFKIYMVLSEDCDLEKILSIAEGYMVNYQLVFTKKIAGENNFIFEMDYR